MELLKYVFSQTYVIITVAVYILFMMYKMKQRKKIKLMKNYAKTLDSNRELADMETSIEETMVGVSFIFALIILFSFGILESDLEAKKEEEVRKRIFEGNHEYIYKVIANNTNVFYLKTSRGWMEIEKELYFELKNKGIMEN
jgi:hypothetical protein